jgi:hypothetical protein
MPLTRDFKGTIQARARRDAAFCESLLREALDVLLGLMRMLGPNGNPQARNLFAIVAYLQEKEGLRFSVRSARA